MKSAAGTIRLDLAQYREMEVFTQFSSDLDETTKRQLVYGQGLMRLLRQAQYHPLAQHEQVILLTAALGHIMQELSPDQVGRFEAAFCRTSPNRPRTSASGLIPPASFPPRTVRRLWTWPTAASTLSSRRRWRPNKLPPLKRRVNNDGEHQGNQKPY